MNSGESDPRDRKIIEFVKVFVDFINGTLYAHKAFGLRGLAQFTQAARAPPLGVYAFLTNAAATVRSVGSDGGADLP